MLQQSFTVDKTEAGCDEAGRGCLAGPVFAAAVILPKNFRCNELNDSKLMTEKARFRIRKIIIENADAWAVASADNSEIDEINILNASFLAMHRAIKNLKVKPGLLLIDGNRFNSYPEIPHQCIIKGDSKFLSIAAASVLAKTFRDDFMMNVHDHYPEYNWKQNKGYPTRFHRKAILQHGITPLHRKTFNLNEQLQIKFQ
jgi:ribonuclease HII